MADRYRIIDSYNMKHRFSFGFFAVLTVVVIAGGAGLASRWQETMLLRGEIGLLRLDAGELERLRVENQRLREKQIPAAELEVLRADHAALPRLRAGALQSRA